jgi:hypothetical protein
MQEVINLTIHTIHLLNLESEKKKEIIDIAHQIFKKAKVGILDNQNSVTLLNVPTPLDAAQDISEKLDGDSRYVIVNGAITDKLLEDLMKLTEKYKGVIFLVEDSTKIFLSEGVIKKFQKKGGIIKVLQPIKIIAVTINPTSPLGYQFEKENFFNLMKKNLKIPVYDLGPSS